MLPALLNIPKTQGDWNRFSFDHRDSHDRIRSAIKTQLGLPLNDQPIDPINPANFQQFLQDNSQLHDDMNNALGLQNSDLEDVDLTDPKKLENWVQEHYLEHYYAENKLKIGG